MNTLIRAAKAAWLLWLVLSCMSCTTPDGYLTNEVVTYNGTGDPGQALNLNVLPLLFLGFVLLAVFINAIAKSVTLGAVVIVLAVGGIVANVTTMGNTFLNLAFAVVTVGTIYGIATNRGKVK